MSNQIEVLFLEKCGLYALENSISSNSTTARVVLIAALDNYLKQAYPSAYQKIIESYRSLELFLKNTGREIIRAGLIKNWQNWNYEIMPINLYNNDKRHDHKCFSPLTWKPQDSATLFVFYSKDDKRRYEAERAHMNKKQRKEQERVEREVRENTVISIPITSITKDGPRRQDPLTNEITKLCRLLTPSQKSITDVSFLKKRVQNMLNQVWPGLDYKVAIFGSSANSLALHDADVDFCIVVPEARFEQDLKHYRNRLSKQPKSVYNMFFLASRLKDIGMKNVEAIGHASVPICKFVDPQTGFQCDINTNNILGIENTGMIQKYCTMDSRIRPLVFAIKQFVKQKNINNPRGGTLSSYAYVIMVLHYLMSALPDPVIPSLQKLENKCSSRSCNFKTSKSVLLLQDHQIIKCDARYHDCVQIHNSTEYDLPVKGATTIWEGKNTDSISSLLKGFFQYYSIPVNFTLSIISPDGIIFRPEELSHTKIPFIIQDPFIIGKNVARSCTIVGATIILQEFQRASRLLNEGSHRFSEICDPASNLLRPVDTESMEYRFQQRPPTRSTRISKQDKVVGYLNEKVENVYKAEIHQPMDLLAGSDSEVEAIHTADFLTPYSFDEPLISSNETQITLPLEPTKSEKPELRKAQPSSSSTGDWNPPDTRNISGILELVKRLMVVQPQLENHASFDSYTSKPCTDMSKLLEEPSMQGVHPKDICYLIAQLNFLGDAIADKIVSNSAVKQVQPFSDQEAGLLYVKQLQEMVNSVDLSEDENDLSDVVKNANGLDSDIEYDDDNEFRINYYVHDMSEPLEAYEIYSLLGWYGKVISVTFSESQDTWIAEMVLKHKNIKLLPSKPDFGDIIARGFAIML